MTRGGNTEWVRKGGEREGRREGDGELVDWLMSEGITSGSTKGLGRIEREKEGRKDMKGSTS